MLLYHGSPCIIEKPDIFHSHRRNDYGNGFYCAFDFEQAAEWVTRYPSKNNCVNIYEYNECNYWNVCDLLDGTHTILEWLAIVLRYRQLDLQIRTKRVQNFLIENFCLDLNKFDIIRGYRIDDSYFEIAKRFLDNSLSLNGLEWAMSRGYLGEQIIFITQESIDNSLHFIEHNTDVSSFENQYQQRISNAIFSVQNYDEQGGVYIEDLMQGRISLYDETLFIQRKPY